MEEISMANYSKATKVTLRPFYSHFFTTSNQVFPSSVYLSSFCDGCNQLSQRQGSQLLCTAVVVGLTSFEAFLKMAIQSEDPELIKQETDACNANPMYMQPGPRNRKRMEKGMNTEG